MEPAPKSLDDSQVSIMHFGVGLLAGRSTRRPQHARAVRTSECTACIGLHQAEEHGEAEQDFPRSDC